MPPAMLVIVVRPEIFISRSVLGVTRSAGINSLSLVDVMKQSRMTAGTVADTAVRHCWRRCGSR